MEVDNFMWLYQDFLIVFAAGDYGALAAEGTVANPATCKNCLVVGASEKWNEEYRTTVNFRDPVEDVCAACTFPLYCSRSATINGQFVENASIRNQLLAQLDPCCNDTFQLPPVEIKEQVFMTWSLGLLSVVEQHAKGHFNNILSLKRI